MRLIPVSVCLLLLAAASSGDGWLPLYQQVDADLQAALESRLNSNREWARLQ